MSLVSVNTEWGELEEIIVGRVENARVPVQDEGLYAINYRGYYDAMGDIPSGSYLQKVIEETTEDLEELVLTLEKQNVVVRRPAITDHAVSHGNGHWNSDGKYNYCPRDVLLAIGDLIIEAPMPLRARYSEPLAYKDILLNYFESGCRWISAPKPRLSSDTYLSESEAGVYLNNTEPLFDAANVIRVGRDILYLVSSSGNELGYQWLKRALGDNYKVHACRNLYASTHIDSTITLLRPGLVLLNPSRVNEDNMPELFKNWDKLWCPDMVDTGFVGDKPNSSVWVGMNFIMVNPNLAIVDKTQQPLIKLLERNKINVIPLQLRHCRTLGGGFHCVTLDIRRKGNLASYAD